MGPLQEHRLVWRNHHVPIHRRTFVGRNDKTRSCRKRDQDHCSTRAKILRLDWWIYSCFSFYLRRDVGYQGRIRRIWPNHCSQKVHLDNLHIRNGIVKLEGICVEKGRKITGDLHFLSKSLRSVPSFCVALYRFVRRWTEEL